VPEYPKKPDIMVVNSFNTSTDKITKNLLLRIDTLLNKVDKN